MSYPSHITSTPTPTPIGNPNYASHSHSTFDLQLMMHAIPPSFEIGTSTNIYSLPNEVLGAIFDYLLYMPHTQGDIPAPILVSHICSHWRNVIIHMPAQWEELLIKHTRRPDVLADLLTRSRNRDLTLLINFQKPMPYQPDAQRDFAATFRAIVAHLPRLHLLSIFADNPTFQNLFDHLSNVPLPNLTHLELSQNGKMPFRFFGPLLLAPGVLRNLRLERAMIECDAACLEGLWSLDLHETSGTILNQQQLSFMSYPDIPAAPTMPYLSRLRIHRTSLISSNTAFIPSFDPTSIMSLELSCIHVTTPQASRPVRDLFRIVLNPCLEELVLVNIDPGALQYFVQIIRTHAPKFPALQALTLVGIHFLPLAPYIIPATPAISCLVLDDAGDNVWTVCEILADMNLWPSVSTFTLNGIEYSRLIES